MKKVILAVFVLSLVVLASCSVVSQYLPEKNGSNESPTGFVVIDNPFVFVNETNETESQSESESESEEGEEESESSESESEFTQEEPLVFATVTATEGDIVSLKDLLAEDPDGDTVQYTYSTPFNDEGLWQTNDGDEGKYLVTIEATDGFLSTSEQLQIVVLASNKGPVIDCPDTLEAAEGDFIDLPCTIYDKEGDEVTFTVSGFMQELTYQSGFDDAGSHLVFISADDGNRKTTKEINVEISNSNRAPVVDALEPISVLEGEEIALVILASDADGDDLDVEYPLLFNNDGVWQTTKGDAGNYELEAIVSDGEDNVIVPVDIFVEKVNTAPSLADMSPIFVDEGETIELDINVQDEDGDDIELTIEGFMTSETYTTTFDDAGDHEVSVTATDGKLSVTKTVAITVADVNRPPVFVLK